MLPPFDMSVPTDARYRTLAPDVAAKFAELAGCAAAAATEVRAKVDAATESMAAAGESLAVGCSTTGREVVVEMTCGDQQTTIRQSL